MIFKCFHLRLPEQYHASEYLCYLCGNFIVRNMPVIAVLDKPIDPLEVSRYLQEGRRCLADVHGYRSDLVVTNCSDKGLIGLRPPDGGRSYAFWTDIKYVRSITVS